jgi:hypothetical protein
MGFVSVAKRADERHQTELRVRARSQLPATQAATSSAISFLGLADRRDHPAPWSATDKVTSLVAGDRELIAGALEDLDRVVERVGPFSRRCSRSRPVRWSPPRCATPCGRGCCGENERQVDYVGDAR